MDHIGALLKQKRADRRIISEALTKAHPRQSRHWQRWLKQNADECAALEQAREALAGLQAMKRASATS